MKVKQLLEKLADVPGDTPCFVYDTRSGVDESLSSVLVKPLTFYDLEGSVTGAMKDEGYEQGDVVVMFFVG